VSASGPDRPGGLAALEASLTPEALAETGARLHAFAERAFPICRSITGDGFRRTLEIIRERVPLEVHEVPSGTPVLDWTVPAEWNIREAWIADPSGRRVVDFADSNLHVVGYSEPVRARMTLADLRPRLHSLPDRPSLIPYRTSYYERTWGFCLAHDVLASLAEGEYEVCIDSTLAPGSLTYGELLIPGQQRDEVLISCHSCHPSLANDNLSGMSIASLLAELLAGRRLRYSYRFIFIPGTIGSIVWLARNEAAAQRIGHGLVLTCLGDPGPTTYKRSRRGRAEIDRAVELVLRSSGAPHAVQDFFPYGYDERQYCSPGFNLAVGCLMRTPHGRFPEYHTSADDLSFIRPAALADSFATVVGTLRVLEENRTFRNLQPKGEPQLGRRGLYRAIGGLPGRSGREMAMLWVLNLSDGEHTLVDIAERSGLPFGIVSETAALLESHSLLEEAAS
jgi:aminopeptidase-like protein